MNTEEEEFINNRSLVYTELGKFNVIFEQITHSFKNAIKDISIKNDLKNKLYSDCLIDKLTAEPIKSIFQSMLSIYIKDESERRNINNLISVFSDLIEIRNLLIHCYWSIGVVVNEPVEPFIVGIKSKISKKGVSIYNLDFKIQELINLNYKLEEFNELIFELFKIIATEESDFSKSDFSQFENLNFKSELNKMKSELN